jgi:hypothetical protein
MKPEVRPRRHRRTWIVLIVGIVVLMAALAPALQPATNCGGNNAALSDVHQYCLIASLAADELPDHGFRISDATPEQREDLAHIADDFWIRPARLLVLPSLDRKLRSGPRRITIVCDTAFRNVPRPIWGRGTPRHAAGYSDGSVGLISVAEYQALDRSSLRPLDDLLAEAHPDR